MSVGWTELLSLTGLVGGLIAFLIWERRRKNLEIRKLRLEIEELENSGRMIQRPTAEEIRDILARTEKWQADHRHFAEEEVETVFVRKLRATLISILNDDAESSALQVLRQEWSGVKADAYLRWPEATWKAIDDLLSNLA